MIPIRRDDDTAASSRVVLLGLDPIGANITLRHSRLFVMARLVRATYRGTVLVQVARTKFTPAKAGAVP